MSGINPFKVSRTLLKKDPLKKKILNDLWLSLIWIVILIAWISLVFKTWIHTESMRNLMKYVFDRRSIMFPTELSDIRWMLVQSVVQMRNFLLDFFSLHGGAIITVLTLSSTLAWGTLIVGRNRPLYCCHIGVTSLAISIIGIAYNIFTQIRSLEKFKWYEMLKNLSEGFSYVIFSILALACIAKVGIKHIPDIFKKTSRVYFHFPCLTLFTIFIYALATLIFVVSYAVMKFAKDHESLTIYMVWFEAYYLILSLHYFGMAVISKVTASWNWIEDRSENPNIIVTRCIIGVFKYQLGSIAFAATGVGPLIALSISLFFSKKDYLIKKPKFERISEIGLTLYLIYDITKYSIMVNSFRDENFSFSIRKVLRVFKKNSSQSISFLWVFYGYIMAVFVTMLMTASITISIWINLTSTSSEMSIWELINVTLFNTSIALSTLMLPLFVVVDTTACTNYLCTVEDEEIIHHNEAISMIPMSSSQIEPARCLE